MAICVSNIYVLHVCTELHDDYTVPACMHKVTKESIFVDFGYG